MIINCFYEEAPQFCDLVYIPDFIVDIEKTQKQFFEWMFNKNNDHKYWVIVDSQKLYCEYGTQAFVDWINDNSAKETSDKSYIVKGNATCWNEKDVCVYF